MSFLRKEIGKVLTKIRNEKFKSNDIKNFQTKVEKKLKELDNSQNLRVYDKKEGGVLRGPKKSRKKYENGTDLLCDPKYMAHGRNRCPSEVPYMRALFNAKKLGNYDIIAYETPLMRKKSKANKYISGREVSCDLLGINKNQICCIEVKTVPDSDGTILPYAILEGFAYAVCIKWLYQARKSELKDELQLCWDEFIGIAPSPIPSEIKFAIAAPYKDYFRPYKIKKITGRNHTKKWFDRRYQEIDILENQKDIKKMFAGYLVLSPSIYDVKKKTVGKYIKPYFASPPKIKQTSYVFKNIQYLG